MAKIIQFTGKFIAGNKYEEINLNSDCITTIDRATDKENQPVTCINITPNNSIYTKLSVEEVIKLVND